MKLIHHLSTNQNSEVISINGPVVVIKLLLISLPAMSSEKDDRILDNDMAATDLEVVEEMAVVSNTRRNPPPPPPPQLPATPRLPASLTIAQLPLTWRPQAPPVPAPPMPASLAQDALLPPQMPVPWASSQTSQLTIC